ncbi:MAG TPA: tetratricopeptide repeat protein [Thermoanaerobaculia bacterium]
MKAQGRKQKAEKFTIPMAWAVFCLLPSALCLPAYAQEAPPVEAQQPPPAASPETSTDEFSKAAYFGKKFFELHDYASAYEQFAKADALRPDQPAVLYDMALVLAKAGRYAEAQVKADRYLQLFPNGAERPHVQRLQLDLEFQREVEKKRQADQNYVDLFGRATFLYGKNQTAEALALFQQAEGLRPNDAAAVYNQAVVLEKQGELTKAVERYRRYAEVERDPELRAGVDQRVFAIETELKEMQTKIVCAFCGYKLPDGTAWCHRCWHATAGTRPCGDGVSATRTTTFADDRFHRNDVLPCVETVDYSAARQKAIQNARKEEGWTYAGDIIQGWTDKIRYHQGAEYLEKVTAASGDTLTYVAHKLGEGFVLDREELVIDAQKYTSKYSFDARGRITQQQVEYQNGAACNHLIAMTADYVYSDQGLAQVKLKGGYEGFPAEGSPKTEWAANVGYTHDEHGRIAKEELTVTSFQKTFAQRPHGELREEVKNLYAAMRPKQPVDLLRTGDLCATAGTVMIGNLIDLRPFYAMLPNLAMTLPRGVAKATVNYTPARAVAQMGK